MDPTRLAAFWRGGELAVPAISGSSLPVSGTSTKQTRVSTPAELSKSPGLVAIKEAGGTRYIALSPGPRVLPSSAPLQDPEQKKMGRQAAVALYVTSMVAIVVGVDLLFFRDRFWERLMVNVGIVLVFGAFYLRFLNRL